MQGRDSAEHPAAEPERREAVFSRLASGPVELTRYEISAGRRIVCGRMRGSRVVITDHDATGRGHNYVVEQATWVESGPALAALIRDYVTQALRHNLVPMASGRKAQLPPSGVRRCQHDGLDVR